MQRYLNRFHGMRPEYLQQYFDWFVCVFRVKRGDEEWKKARRLVRDPLLSEAVWARKMRNHGIY